MQPLNVVYGAALSRWFGILALKNELAASSLVHDGPIPIGEGKAEEWIARATALGVDRVDLERRFKAWVASDDEEALGAMYDLLQASGTAAVADLAAVPPSLGKALDQLRGAIGDQLAARHAIGDDGVYDAMCTLAVACGQ